MGFGQWKPQEKIIDNQQFYKNQKVSFIYKKELYEGRISKLLINSAIVTVPTFSKTSTLAEKTVISYKDLIK